MKGSAYRSDGAFPAQGGDALAVVAQLGEQGIGMLAQFGPTQSAEPGVADSLGTMPGMRNGLPSGKRAERNISRARNCGSRNMSSAE